MAEIWLASPWMGNRALRFIVPLFLIGVVAVRPWRYGLAPYWAAVPALASKSSFA